MGTIHTILHPTDFSESANNAFQWACSLAKANQARLIVLHIMLPSSAPILASPAPDPMQPAESQADLKGAFPWPEPSDPDVIVEHRVAEGDAPLVILRLATAMKCDVIVMGTHGRSGLSRLLTGSVAEEVLRKATCPVLVVKDLPENKSIEKEDSGKLGEVVDVCRHRVEIPSSNTSLLLARGDQMEVRRLVISNAQEIHELVTTCETVAHCVAGKVAITIQGKTKALTEGQLICLPGGQSYSIKGVEPATLVLTAAQFLKNGG
jgi:nucleotide-binding universal stress UspA family protein/quercetin dioxygenase-like cupin family protein